MSCIIGDRPRRPARGRRAAIPDAMRRAGAAALIGDCEPAVTLRDPGSALRDLIPQRARDDGVTPRARDDGVTPRAREDGWGGYQTINAVIPDAMRRAGAASLIRDRRSARFAP